MHGLRWALVAALGSTLAGPAAMGASARQTGEDATLPGEWQLPAPPAEVFTAAEAVLLEMGLRVARRDAPGGILVTREAGYDAAWPDGESLGLLPTRTPRRAEFNVFVAPNIMPARLAVGAVLTTDTVFTPLRGAKSRGTSTIYGHPPLAAVLAQRIAARLGVNLAPLSVDASARASASAESGRGVATRCGTPPLADAATAASAPVLLSQVTPQYPPTDLARRAGGEVVLSGEVLEHGTLTGLRWVAGVEDRNLVAAAMGAAGLWRFRPAMVEGCAVRRRIAVAVGFTIR